MESRGPEDIRALNPAVPDSLKRVITKSVAFDPGQRYANAAEFSKRSPKPARFCRNRPLTKCRSLRETGL